MDKNKIIQAATKYVQRGQFDKAIAEYQKARKADPKDVRILLKIGELHQKKGDNALAATTLLDVAKSYAGDGFFLKAVAVYKQIVKLDPSRISVNLELAELYQQLGLNSDAMSQLQTVANHYEGEGKAAEALEILRRMVDLDPDNVTSRIKLGELFAQQGQSAEALRELRISAEHLKSHNRMDDYLRVAERIVVLAPDDLRLSLELAGLFLTRRDPRRALARLQVCFNADPRDPETLDLLARAFQELGQKPKAVAVYKELARVHREAGRTDDERIAWRKVLELASDDVEAIESCSRGPSPPLQPPAARGQAEQAHDEAKRLVEERAARERATQERAAQERAAQERVAQERAARERAAQERAAQERAAQERAAQERAAQPRAAQGRASVQQPAAAPRPTPPSPRGAVASTAGGAPPEAGKEPLSKLLSEMDVYIRYGLYEKAKAHLPLIFSIDPGSLDGHERAIQLYTALDDGESLRQAMVRMMRECLAQRELERGRALLHRFIDAAPDHPELQELLEAFSKAEEQEQEEEQAPAPEASLILDIEDTGVEEARPAQVAWDPKRRENVAARMAVERENLEETRGPSFLDDLPEGDEELFGGEGDEDESVFLTESDEAAGAEEDSLFVSGADDGDDSEDEAVFVTATGEIDPGEGDAALELLRKDDDLLVQLSKETIDDAVLAPAAELELDRLLLVGGAVLAPEEELVDELGEAEVLDDDEVFGDAGGGFPTDGSFLIADEAGDAGIVADDGLDAALLPGAEDDGIVSDEEFEAALLAATADEAIVVDDDLDSGAAPWSGEHAEPLAGSEQAPPMEPELEAIPPGRFDNSEIEVELEEGAFFLEGGYLGEAEERFRSVLRRVPDHPIALGFLQRMAEGVPPAANGVEAPAIAEPLATEAVKDRSSEEAAPLPDRRASDAASETFDEVLEVAAAAAADLESSLGPHIDLAQELAGDFDELVPEPSLVAAPFQYSVDDVLAEFKKGVSQTVSAEDSETHYDLGIAYKEMGLLQDAVAEFEIARQGTIGQKKEVDCLTLAGMCEALLGNHERAIACFLAGLGAAAVSPETAMALHFEIALSCEAIDDRDQALAHYGKVARIDPAYRQVQNSIRRLEVGAALPAEGRRHHEEMGEL